jgi:glc operon protein GlcG
MLRKMVLMFVLALTALSTQAQIQTQPQAPAPAKSPNYFTLPYGLPINLELAKKIGDAAYNHGIKNGWAMAVAIVDYSGNLIYFVRADNNQIGGVEVALRKAKAAAIFKRPTKLFEDALARGGRDLRVLTLKGAIAAEGGLPIIIDGKVVGAIGVSGDVSSNDALAAEAGLAVLKKEK